MQTTKSTENTVSNTVSEKEPTVYNKFKDATTEIMDALFNVEKLARLIYRLPASSAGYRFEDGTLGNRKLVQALFTEIRGSVKALPKHFKDALSEEKEKKKNKRGKKRNPLYDPLDIGKELDAFFNDSSVNFGYTRPGDSKSGLLVESMKHFNEMGQTNRIQIAFLLQIHCLLEGTFLPGPGGLCKATPAMHKHFAAIFKQIHQDQVKKFEEREAENRRKQEAGEEVKEKKMNPFDENGISYINFQVLISYLTKSNQDLSKEEKESIREEMMEENDIVKNNTKVYKNNSDVRIKA